MRFMKSSVPEFHHKSAVSIYEEIVFSSGDNNIENKNSHGIFVVEGGKLTITGSSTDTLIATGGGEGSGIGGSGSIIIKGGNIKATGGLFGNGIGFGTSSKSQLENSDNNAGNIMISGGNVTAIGGKLGSAGIGYSSTKTKGKITIINGTVYATSGSSGIGSYDSSVGNDIQLLGGNVTAIGNAYSGTSEVSVLSGSNYSNVFVHGGTFNVDTIGCLEEVTDLTSQKFMITNGEVNVSKRIIFTNFTIIGGSMNVHLLGSGYGTDFTMYGGDVLMDQFITNYSSYYDKEKGKYTEFQYETSNGVSKESLLNKSTLFGGNIKETHNVSVNELKKILYGHQ